MVQLIGKVLHNRYRIQSLLGRQKGRRTFLASDLQTGLSVVVKLLLFGPDFAWDDLKLFEREAEVLKSLDHPAIPTYLDYFETETELGKGFTLVQTYIEAKSLQDWTESGRTFGEEELKAMVKELLGIMEYLHNRQPPVVHRDIKPSNILLGDRSGNSYGQIYVVDFGSVQTAIHDGTRTIVGTYGYMPPEQFGGYSAPTSDLYALGATLIYLATGQHPDKLPQGEMRLLFEDKVNLDAAFIQWLKWLTEPSIDLRLKSAKQALEALETSNFREQSLAILTQPKGSKIRVTKTPQMLEIVIPPRASTSAEIFVAIVGALIYFSFSGPISMALLMGIFMGGIAFPPISISNWNDILSFFLIAGFRCFVGFGAVSAGILPWFMCIMSFLKQRLRITPSEISLSWSWSSRFRPGKTAASRDIVKLELIRHRYKERTKEIVEVQPRINIWAGTTKFELGGDASFCGKILTIPELDWLAQELSSWLNLPITRE